MDALTAVTFLGGLVLLVGGAEALVRGSSRLAAGFGVPPLVVGLTIVAFGTSSPELAVSVGGALAGADELALGNVVGSNIFNVLAILGLSALVGRLAVHQRIARIDVPLLVAVTAAVWVMAADGRVGRLEGLFLCAGIVAYTGWLYRAARRERRAVAEEYEEAFGSDAASARRRWPLATLGVAAGLGALVVGARLLVSAASAIAGALGVPDLVIGLTVVAAGTSMPELATSVVAAVRGERDIAVGNVVGSNLFNLLAVLGASAVVAPRGMGAPPAVVALDLPVALLVTLVALPVLATGLAIERWEGAVLLSGYAGYVTVVVLAGLAAPAAPTARIALLIALALAALLLTAVGVSKGRAARR